MDRPQERLALIECAERDGRGARALDVRAWPLTIGRALDNDLVLDDPYVAAHHARLERDAEGRLQLVALPGVNGVVHDHRRIAPGQTLVLPAGGALLQFGQTRLRLRLPAEVLAPERPLPSLRRGALALPWLAGAALLALQAAEQWLGLDPGADYSAWLPVLVGLPLGVAGWCGLWALLSKVFQHRFDFLGHLRIALPGLLAIGLFDAMWPQAMAAIGAPTMWQLGAPLQALLLAGLVHAHLRHLLPLHPRAVTASVLALVVAGGAISLALTHRRSDSYAAAPYMSTLPLPAWRWAGTVPPTDLVESMAPLAQTLAQRVNKARDEDAQDEADDGD